MTTSFSSLPVVDFRDLKTDDKVPGNADMRLGEQLYDAFATTGFAYLVNAPLSFSHEAVFNMSRRFFSLPTEKKMKLAKKTFVQENTNTYRGYFPVQPLSASDNLKEGFEMGSTNLATPCQLRHVTNRLDLCEANVWPDEAIFSDRASLEQLYKELQTLSSRLLSMLALSLGKNHDYFASYLEDSLSTLRLLHYPTIDRELAATSTSMESLGSVESAQSWGSQTPFSDMEDTPVKLSCTPHTDSGILTLLHQDPTGGLEVRNSLGQWVPAPYIPGSIVVNIGDLMAEVSGGRFVATMHRVRAPLSEASTTTSGGGNNMQPSFGRLSVPFFFEPGENCVVRSVDDDGTGCGISYGEHVRRKMKTWVEFQDAEDSDEELLTSGDHEASLTAR